LKYKDIYFLAFAFLAICLQSCGVEKTNVVSRKYHNTTTFFNYLYNGELKWKEGVDQINAAYRIPPEGYIDVMYSGTEEDATTYKDNFEQAIEKAEIALQKHNQADNKYLDNCRYLIGRSWYYKRSYVLAIKNFEYVIKTYPDSKIIPDVYLWLVKTHYMDDNNLKALKILEEDVKKLDLDKRQKGEMAMIQSQILLDEGRYEQLVRVLNKNKKNIKGKTNRARAYYLLGQIYSDQGSYSKAFEAFRKVTRINTDYELIFNAKIHIAKLMIDEQGGSGESAKLNRYLKKMLRDEKNLDYRDQIYYEMAMLYLQQNLLEKGIEHLKLSVAANTNNQRQKAISYYKIGQIYFYDLKDFTNAEAYFDSASTAINKDAPEYAEISNISKTLKEYIGYVNVISEQDSLLALSKLSDQALEKRVDKILKDKEEREKAEQEKQLEELDRLNDPNLFNNLNDNRGGRRGGFYFDNPELITQGKAEFEQRWGRRANEDNWRRKNKQVAAVAENTSEASDTAAIDPEILKKYGSEEKARMIANVPKTANEIAEANQAVAEALYGLGQVYENKLTILDSAKANYKKLIRRYPDNEYALRARYAMYRIYKDKIQDELRAADYEAEICGKYPESRYCKIIKNGAAGAAELDQQFTDFMSAYDALLVTYNSGDYSTCVDFSGFISSRFPTQPGLAEVYYIKGKSYGFAGQKDSLKSVYEYIVQNYPDSDVTPEVRRTLAFLSGKAPGDKPGDNGNGGPPSSEDFFSDANNPAYKGFTTDRRPQEKVYIVMLLDRSKIKSNELQQKLNDYNRGAFPERRLNVSVFLYKGKYHLPYISQFNDEQEALSYITNLSKEPDIGGLFGGKNEKIVFITPKNFRTAYGKKRFEDYFIYYENVVLKELKNN